MNIRPLLGSQQAEDEEEQIAAIDDEMEARLGSTFGGEPDQQLRQPPPAVGRRGPSPEGALGTVEAAAARPQEHEEGAHHRQIDPRREQREGRGVENR